MSTAKLGKLKWGYMFSYADNNEVDLGAEKLTQIVGTNGVGKSSIPTILEEIAYSKNSRGFKKAEIPNRHFNKPYWASLEFSINGDEYLLSMKKSTTLSATMLKNGEDISKHTASGTIGMFEELTGFDFKTFSQLIYQNTDSSLMFLSATDSKRKEFLVNLFNLVEYGEKYEKANNALKDLKKRVSTIEGSIQVAEAAVARAIENSNIPEETFLPIPEFPDELVEEKSALQKTKDEIEATNKRIARENKVLTDLAKLRTLDEIQNDIDSLGESESKSPLIEELGKRNAAITAAKTLVEKLNKLGNKCPTCLQDVDNDFVNSLIKENEEIMADNRAKAQELVSDIDKITKKESRLKALNSEMVGRKNLESQKVSEVYQDLQDPEDLEEKIKSLESNIRSVRSAIDNAQAENQKISARSGKREAAKAELEASTATLDRLTEELSSVSKDIPALEVLKKAFSPTGLVAYKLENRVKDLEDFTNNYLGMLSDGQFNLAFEIEKDKLNVVIYDESNPVSMNSLSSGEKARVVIGTLLGIRKIMQSISKSTINVLFLDEVISVMDNTGKEQLVDVLMKEENLNSFLVNHSWTHPLVSKLEVSKHDGISTID